tara:strand:+ start:976 stop:1230 length:255 start_codon:yes stop_codon:yes gene_type:complete
MYRLHVDIPLGHNGDIAKQVAEQIIKWMFRDGDAQERIQRLALDKLEIQEINCRLGNDEDRQKSNYLDVNENGHITNKKIRIRI